MSKYQLTPEQVQLYHQNGYVIVKNFLTPAEVQKLHSVATGDDTLQKHAFDLNDQTGKKQNLLYGTHPVMMRMGYLQKVSA